MHNKIVPKHIKNFFDLGSDLNKHQDPGKFKMQLNALQTRSKKEGNEKGVLFIKKQKKLLRFR